MTAGWKTEVDLLALRTSNVFACLFIGMPQPLPHFLCEVVLQRFHQLIIIFMWQSILIRQFLVGVLRWRDFGLCTCALDLQFELRDDGSFRFLRKQALQMLPFDRLLGIAQELPATEKVCQKS